MKAKNPSKKKMDLKIKLEFATRRNWERECFIYIENDVRKPKYFIAKVIKSRFKADFNCNSGRISIAELFFQSYFFLQLSSVFYENLRLSKSLNAQRNSLNTIIDLYKKSVVFSFRICSISSIETEFRVIFFHFFSFSFVCLLLNFILSGKREIQKNKPTNRERAQSRKSARIDIDRFCCIT